MLVVTPCRRYCRQKVFRFQGRGLPLSKGGGGVDKNSPEGVTGTGPSGMPESGQSRTSMLLSGDGVVLLGRGGRLRVACRSTAMVMSPAFMSCCRVAKAF